MGARKTAGRANKKYCSSDPIAKNFDPYRLTALAMGVPGEVT
jgi:hypothetical protein